jgi:SAM-dependent methyltransferase
MFLFNEKQNESSQSKNDQFLKKKTSDSFGFEWKQFHNLKSEKGFLDFISPIDKNFFLGKFVLDAGCGNGSYSRYSAVYGAEVIAIDFSDAVYVAQENTRDTNVQIIQADITRPPFKDNTFSYIFSIGVLHHLPDPEEGFRHLVPLLTQNGLISIWVYGREKQWAAVLFYEPIIKITHRLPHRILYYLCFVPAIIVHLTNFCYKLLKRYHFSKMAAILPFKFYADHPFSVKLNDAFDVFATPSAVYYTEAEILNWFLRSNMKDIKITSDGVVKGIKGFGIKR